MSYLGVSESVFAYITYSFNLPGEGLECRYCSTLEDHEDRAGCFNDGPLNMCPTTANACYESALYVTLIPSQGSLHTKQRII